MTEDSYKNHVKKLIEKAAFRYLNELKESHIKVKENKYKELEAQNYILSHQFSNKEKSTLFMLRSNTTRGIKNNFSSWYKPNLSCPMSCQNIDDQRHLLKCAPTIARLSTEQQILTHTVKYEDIYGCLEKQKGAVNVFSWLLEARERLLGAATPASGVSLDASPEGVYRGLGD